MPRARRHSSSFNPRLLLALQAGCKQQIRIPFATANEAIRCRQDINKLRASLREEGNPDWRIYSSVGVYIDKQSPETVILKPKLEDYKLALDAAVVPDFVDPPAAPAVVESPALEEIKKDNTCRSLVRGCGIRSLYDLLIAADQFRSLRYLYGRQ